MGTTSNHHAPYVLGYTRNTMAVNKGKQYREVEQNPKNGLSSDCRLQPACTKLELLVIADQHAAVNTFPGLVHTARRFFALLRIKPHNPLLVRVPVNSFEFQPCGRTPQVDNLLR